MSGYNHRGHVYFAAAGRYVKIGFSSQRVGARLESMFNSGRLICPVDIDRRYPPSLIHVVPGCVMRDEKRLHGLFAAHHAIGEWYRLTDSFRDQLASLRYVTYHEELAELRRVRREIGTAA